MTYVTTQLGAIPGRRKLAPNHSRRKVVHKRNAGSGRNYTRRAVRPGVEIWRSRGAAMPANYSALSGYDDGLGFSLKPPKRLRRALHAIKRAVTLKHVLEAGAIAATAFIAAPALLAVGRVALPMLARGAVGGARFLGHEVATGARFLGREGSALEKAIANRISGKGAASSGGAGGDYGPFQDPGMSPANQNDPTARNTPTGGTGGNTYGPPMDQGPQSPAYGPSPMDYGNPAGPVASGASSPGVGPAPATPEPDDGGDDSQDQAVNAESVAPKTPSAAPVLIGVGVVTLLALAASARRRRRAA